MKLQQTQLLLLLLLPGSLFSMAGGDPPPAVGARAISLGRAYVGINEDVWCIFHNPAGIAGLTHPVVGAYVERRFLLRELSYGSATGVIPFGQDQAIGMYVSDFGFDLYRESQIGLAYAIRILDKISLGSQLTYANVTIRDYGAAAVWMVNMGVHTQVNDQLSLGVSAYNVNRSKLHTSGPPEMVPTVLSAGLAYQPTPQLLVLAEVQKDVDHAVSYRGGLEYEMVPALKARAGVSTEVLTFNAGLGFNWKSFNLDFAVSYTEKLGYSPHLSLAYQIGT